MHAQTLTIAALLTLSLAACAEDPDAPDLDTHHDPVALGDLDAYATTALQPRDAARRDALAPHLARPDALDRKQNTTLHGDFTAPRCAQTGTPALQHITVARGDLTSAFDVELHGLSCDASIDHFDFRVYDADGNDITSRSWPEVNEIEQRADGTFTLRGVAASCGDFTRATRVVLSLHGSNPMDAAVTPL
jgi:hypothetical protein